MAPFSISGGNLNYLHLTDGPDGLSRFSEGEIDLSESDFAPPAPPMLSSVPEDCTIFLININKNNYLCD